MATATIRDLRTRFPHLKNLIAREGEVIVTDRGRPAYVLRTFAARVDDDSTTVDYFGRLKARQPHPLSRAASDALDAADRGER